MTISIQYNGIELTKYLDAVIDITRNVGQNRTPSLVKVGHTDGQRFQYTTASEGTITITAIIRNQKTERRRALAQALMQSEPAKLIFSDEPGLYYLAITTGQQALAEQFLHNTLTLSLIVPDGIAHSVAVQTTDNMPYKNLSDNLLHSTGDDWNPNIWSQNGTATTQDGITTATNTSKSVISTVVDPNDSSRLTSGATVTTSVDVKGQGSILFGYYTGSDWEGDSPAQQVNSDEYIRIYFTRVINSTHFDTGHPKFAIDAICPTSTLTIRHVKVEQGTSASPWSPNPADPEYYSDTITVPNSGTYPVYPVIEATMHSDNGVLTLINENNGGIIQLGNAGEIDGVQAPNSETVFHYDLLSAPSGVAVNTGKINYPNYPYGSNPGPNTIAGSWDYAKAPDAATPVLNRTSSMHWAGPTYHGPIKANAAGVNTGNLIWSNRFNVTTSVGALGRAEFNLQSGDDIAICFVIRDSAYAADMLTVEGWVNGQNIFSQDLNRKMFTNGMYEIVESKLGNTITFKLTKIKQLSASGIISSAQIVFPPVTIDGVADTPIDSFTVWMAGFSNKTGWTINWSDSVFQWVNVDYWKDLPNRFTDGDTLLVDPSQIKVFVNDVEDRTLHAIDNDWEKFRLGPGETKIKIIASEFAATPTVVATYREAFL